MELYFDIGNTNIKLNFKLYKQEYFVNYETHGTYSVDTFYLQLPEQVRNSKITNAYICSVVPEKDSLIEGVLKKYFQIKPTLIAYPIKTGLQIKSHDPKAIGADLVALGAFLNERDRDLSVMVNVGTATTIVATKNGFLEGVIIAPGLEQSLKSLINKASKLSNLKLSITDKILGQNTQEAISIGSLHGHTEMIKALVSKLSPKIVYLSGGLSRKIKDLLPEYTYVKEATIAGMKEIVKINNEKI